MFEQIVSGLGCWGYNCAGNVCVCFSVSGVAITAPKVAVFFTSTLRPGSLVKTILASAGESLNTLSFRKSP